MILALADLAGRILDRLIPALEWLQREAWSRVDGIDYHRVKMDRDVWRRKRP